MARPRNAASDEALLAAAAETLRDHGYDALVFDELARRVGVAKTTVYRRWPTKNHLVVDVVALGQHEVPVPDTGDVDDDLRSVLLGMSRAIAAGSIRRVAAELLAAAASDPDLAARVAGLWSPHRSAVVAVLERAAAAGRLPVDLDTEVVADQLAGAVCYRVLVAGDGIDEDYAGRLVRSATGGTR
jgi:AcrR family transcriptional regulator